VVDADLERIRFGMPLDEQHPPADFRIDSSRATAVLRLEPIKAMVAAELTRAGD
jgi:hypothetical protein